jgi:ubiquinone/menaquinone biosynthesis C-methylase UbiE
MQQVGALGIDSAALMELAGIKEGDRVADLGCGSHGAFVFDSARIAGKNGRVYAVDIQKSVLEAIASKRKIWPTNGQIEIVWSNLEKVGATTIPEASLDVAFLMNVLNQSEHHDSVLKEATRLLRPGGVLLVVDWESLDAPFAPQACCQANPEDLKRFAAEVGLQFESSFASSQNHFGLKFIKS